MQEEAMQETIGTLNLKIARLEHQLNVLKQRLFLSRTYLDYNESLSRQELQLQAQLNQLIKCREQLRQQVVIEPAGEEAYYANIREVREEGQKNRSFWPVT